MHWLVRVAVLGIALWPAAIAEAQVRIVVRPSVEPRGGPAPQPEAPPVETVLPIEPSAEEAARIAELIEQLGAARLAQRDRAMAELARFEARALRQVREAKEHQDDEVANRCTVLEEVIQSRQAELFLAARRLSLQPSELERMLAAQDIKPLLDILKARAQPGLTPLWARVLGMLSVRSQVIPAAQLCMSVEGAEGYGMALADAARAPALHPQQALGLIGLASMLPPARAQETVETLAFCGMAAGGAEGIQRALQAASMLRGLFPAADVLAALRLQEDSRRRLSAEGHGLRQAVALSLAPPCRPEELRGTGVPALGAMSPLVLSEYLALLRRGGLVNEIENALVSLVTLGASARALSTAGAAWADAVPIERMQKAFSALPGAAQLGALDALWLNPRDPARLQPFLVALLKHSDISLRMAGARGLAQFRAPSTARALAELALVDSTAAQFALESLAPMADLLPAHAPEPLARLVALLPGADLSVRAALIDTLVNTRDAGATKALRETWATHLPRNELLPACVLLATDTTTPAGAFAASLLLGVESGVDRVRVFSNLDHRALVLMRALMSGTPEAGFALLRRLCADETSQSRAWAASALSLAGQDGDLVQDWIRRLVGETPDAQPHTLMMGVALSVQQAAEDFRRRALQQGATSPHLQAVLIAVYAGRSRTITRDQMLRGLFDTPANARNWVGYAGALNGPIPADAMKTIVTTVLFSEEIQPLADPALALLVAESGVDVLQLLYGDDANAKPHDAARAVLTALLGEPGRARELIGRAEAAEDGSNYAALQFARAWLGMLEPAQAQRMLRGGTDRTTRVFALRRAAQAGSATALRGLLDRFSVRAGEFAEGATAGIEMVSDRWRGTSVELEGVAGEALGFDNSNRDAPTYRLQCFFTETIPADWNAWWGCRRGLLELDASTGKYRFLELP